MDFRKLQPEDATTAATLFATLEGDPHFQPHEMTLARARELCGHQGGDGYYGGFEGGTMVAYGILQGWDAGFEHPSLGIAVHVAFRGLGHGARMMAFLHQEALRLGSTRIRLRVHPDNAIACSLYEGLGYCFDGELDRGQLVGWRILRSR